MLTDSEIALLKTLYEAPASKKNPRGVHELLEEQGDIVSLNGVMSAFRKLVATGYIVQSYSLTPLAESEIGIEE
jgi:hypothetical protein